MSATSPAAAVPTTIPGFQLFLDIDTQPGPAFASMWTRIFTGGSLGGGISLLIAIATALLLLVGHLVGASSARKVTAIYRPAPNAANRRSRMAARASVYGARRASAYGGSRRNSAQAGGGSQRTSQYSGNNAKRQSVMFAFNDASGAAAAAAAPTSPHQPGTTKQRSDRHRMSIISVVTSPPELQPRGGRKRAASSLAAHRQSIFSFSGFGKAPHPQSTAAARRAHIRNSSLGGGGGGGGADQRTIQLLEFHPYQSPGTFVVATAEMYYAETASMADDDWWDDGDVWDNVEILEEEYQSDDDDALPPMPERIPLPPLPRVEKLPHMVLDVSSA
ncbi:hypothetical protein HDU87_005911 [Geranomyces variabilis]|uniref:Uncharacterized protein n=1 Tax=Geranomyces variabilis TaxID=109894 RepID=A0AAD5TQ58_9FUNG|nr:hypothetical protein HDU87_005911 [Geranomyces variabilis]